jgi:hypothetical protein
MPFVKLDCGILQSTLWMDQVAREVFITALLMAEPAEFDDPIEQIETRTLEMTGWAAPPGWYGFVPAAGVGIIRTAGVEIEAGKDALERLGWPDENSRSHEFEGRRLIRIDGGYLILNYMKYRDRDYTGAERQRRYRKRQAEKRNTVTQLGDTVTSRSVTQAEAEAEAEARVKRLRSSSVGTLVPSYSERGNGSDVLQKRPEAEKNRKHVRSLAAAAIKGVPQ